jgi:hypothetical protein
MDCCCSYDFESIFTTNLDGTPYSNEIDGKGKRPVFFASLDVFTQLVHTPVCKICARRSIDTHTLTHADTYTQKRRVWTWKSSNITRYLWACTHLDTDRNVLRGASILFGRVSWQWHSEPYSSSFFMQMTRVVWPSWLKIKWMQKVSFLALFRREKKVSWMKNGTNSVAWNSWRSRVAYVTGRKS